jgi:hypothetical protein
MVCHQNVEQLIPLHAISHRVLHDHQPQSRPLTSPTQKINPHLLLCPPTPLWPPSLYLCVKMLHSVCR